MLRNLHLLLGFYFSVCSPLSHAEIPAARQSELITIIERDEDVDSLSAEEKEVVLEYILKEKEKRPDDHLWSDKQLLQLAHEPTIQRYAKLFKLGVTEYGRADFAKQPRLIEHYEAALMAKGPPSPTRGSDVPGISNTLDAGLKMLRLTQQSWEIPEDTRVWSQRLIRVIEQNMRYHYSPTDRRIARESRLIVRNWFTENKAALQAREFAKVKPGALHTLQKEAEPLALGEEPRNVLAGPTPIPTPNTPPPETKTTGKIQGGYWAFAILGVCVALLAVGVFLTARGNAK